MDDNYWGLFAVVKGCSSATTSTAKKTTLDSLLSSVDGHSRLDFQTKKQNDYLSELNESGRITSQHEVLIPTCPEMQPTFSQAEPMSVFSIKSLDIFSRAPKQLQQEQVLVAASTVGTVGQSQLPRPRKRQSLSKMVYEVPKGSRDEWSWRKYGQKPIKGSPYPRSYYKCNSSTSIGCLARKKVELKTDDPTMQVVTYVGNHNHQLPEKRRSFYTNIWGQNSTSDLTLAQGPLAISQIPKKNENDIRLREIPDDIFLGWEDFPFLTEDEFPRGAMHP